MKKRGRPRLPVKLDLADRLRTSGLSWDEVSKMLDVHRNTLLAHRTRAHTEATERFQMPRQKRMLVAAGRFLRANQGEGLSPMELRSAEDLVRYLSAIYREAAGLRETLAKVQAQIHDYERMMRR